MRSQVSVAAQPRSEGATAHSNLVCDVRARVADVPVHLAHDADMLVAVEKRILLLSGKAVAAIAAYSFVCLKTRVAKHDNETFRAMVTLRDRQTLFGC
jgi:hypothetical protein